MHQETKSIQEKIIKAINYIKTNRKRRATSEDIYNFVNDGSTQVNFATFKDAMRELRCQRKIYSEKRNGVFSYFIPRVPEIILKVDKSKVKETPAKKNRVVPRCPVREKDIAKPDFVKSSATATVRQNSAPKRKVRSSALPLAEELHNDLFRYLQALDNDKEIEEEIDDEDDDEDIDKLEEFIDKMMDKLDDVVIREPPASIISLYEQRIFDLKSEILFLRKLTSSNNTLLQDEIRFLRDELEAKNSLIKQLSSQLTTTHKSNEETMAPSPKLTYVKNPFTKEISKQLTVGNKNINDQLVDDKKKIKWMGDSLLKGICDTGMNKVKMKGTGGFSPFNIFDHIKPGIIPRQNGFSFHIEECDIRPKICVPKMFDNFFEYMISSPYNNKLCNQVFITELDSKNTSTPNTESTDVVPNKSDPCIVSESPDKPTAKSDIEQKLEFPAEYLTDSSNGDKQKEMDADNLDAYRGWLSLDIMDQIKPSMKNNPEDNLLCFGAGDINLLKICENMSEQVNSINVKLRNYYDQRSIIYDGGHIDDTCLSLNTLPLNCKNNALLANSYVNCRLAT